MTKKLFRSNENYFSWRDSTSNDFFGSSDSKNRSKNDKKWVLAECVHEYFMQNCRQEKPGKRVICWLCLPLWFFDFLCFSNKHLEKKGILREKPRELEKWRVMRPSSGTKRHGNQFQLKFAKFHYEIEHVRAEESVGTDVEIRSTETAEMEVGSGKFWGKCGKMG